MSEKIDKKKAAAGAALIAAGTAAAVIRKNDFDQYESEFKVLEETDG